jgi:glucosyl-3-phosphoglycerate synthase
MNGQNPSLFMKKIKHYNAADFNKRDLLRVKKRRKVIVIFSTCGEREASFIYEKIKLLRTELSDFIDGILVSHRRESDREDETERKARDAWDGVEILVCNSCDVSDMGDERGKGADMRRALYHVNREWNAAGDNGDAAAVFLDADVVPKYFGSHFVLALGGAVLTGNDFAKASFWREMGRIKKFVAQPLYSLIDHPSLQMLTELYYPLSGEMAGTLEFFNSVHFWQRYGVETGINMDVCMGDYRVADVNLGLYDHGHHSDLDIQKMAFGIIRTYLIQLRDYGIIRLSDEARISDMFRASFIDDKGGRQSFAFDLVEKKYQPLQNIL